MLATGLGEPRRYCAVLSVAEACRPHGYCRRQSFRHVVSEKLRARSGWDEQRRGSRRTGGDPFQTFRRSALGALKLEKYARQDDLHQQRLLPGHREPGGNGRGDYHFRVPGGREDAQQGLATPRLHVIIYHQPSQPPGCPALCEPGGAADHRHRRHPPTDPGGGARPAVDRTRSWSVTWAMGAGGTRLLEYGATARAAPSSSSHRSPSPLRL